ncbi:hypothetical protein NL532_10155 [Mesorhizobium sp. C120A]|uniref:hypothetical protein n=1 Tax=unclassified Mesorhizobium TaxID=325217 RepID=UPI001FDA1FB1|nr:MULTISPECIES: hypothetical protein [unclassified Mesorhizobium]WJI46957.1 hypothetical protein NL532_10155 [Mesorhizobium sp. C120A]
MKLFAAFNVYTGDQAKLRAQVLVWSEELEGFPLYAIRKATGGLSGAGTSCRRWPASLPMCGWRSGPTCWRASACLKGWYSSGNRQDMATLVPLYVCAIGCLMAVGAFWRWRAATWSA